MDAATLSLFLLTVLGGAAFLLAVLLGSRKNPK
jgi:hypothetical protein